MECPQCHRYSPPDRETGYDVDELCPECEQMEENRDIANSALRDFETRVAAIVDAAVNGTMIDRAALAHQSTLQDFAIIAVEASATTDRKRLWELLDMARELETRARKLTDDLFGRVEAVLADTEEPDTRSPF